MCRHTSPEDRFVYRYHFFCCKKNVRIFPKKYINFDRYFPLLRPCRAMADSKVDS